MLIFEEKNDKIKGMRNIKLELRFDGAKYHGWQIQPNAVTVQEVVSQAVSKITKENIKVFGCSRTDSGVHANYYVASFKTQLYKCNIGDTITLKVYRENKIKDIKVKLDVALENNS